MNPVSWLVCTLLMLASDDGLLVSPQPDLFTKNFSLVDSSVLKVSRVNDFTITGDGHARAWDGIPWTPLPQRSSGSGVYSTSIKIAYSGTGIYVLFQCPDKKLSASLPSDGLHLWTEDVAEIFLWPDQSTPDYLEFEISPLNHELVLMVANHPGKVVRWQPFPFEEQAKAIHRVKVTGGEAVSNADISAWTAEIYLPFAMMKPLRNCPPQPNTSWRANFYRVDYDHGQQSSDWSWQPVAKSYHEYQRFGTLVFQ